MAKLGGLTEIVEDGVTGWVVEPNDAAVLAQTIARIVTQPGNWRRFGAAARARFDATFSARTIATQFQSIVRARLRARDREAAARGLAPV